MTGHRIINLLLQKSKGLLVFLAMTAIIFVSCGGNSGSDEPSADDPVTNIGAADGLGDQADYQCRIVLRSVSRIPYQGDYATKCTTTKSGSTCLYKWQGKIDVQEAFAKTIKSVKVLYQTTDTGTKWYSVTAKRVGTPENGFVHYTFVIDRYTFKQGTNVNDLHNKFINLIPYAQTKTGRLIDHNRVSDPMGSYNLVMENSWTISEDPNVCKSGGSTTSTPLPEWTFSYPEMKNSLRNGPVKAGGKLKVIYNIDRLIKTQNCLGSHGASSATTIMMGWMINDDDYRVKTTQVASYIEQYGYLCTGGTSPCISKDVKEPILDIPNDAYLLSLWFYCIPGYDSGGSYNWKYDSNQGQNYTIDIK